MNAVSAKKRYFKATDQVVQCEDCEKRFPASFVNLSEKELLELESDSRVGIAKIAKLNVVFAVELF